MKSKTSLFNKAVFRWNLTGRVGLWIGFFLLWLFVLPFNVYVNLKNLMHYADFQQLAAEEILFTKSNQMIQVIANNMSSFIPLFAGLAIVSAMFSFSYLFTARSANMMHTFPLNRMSLFRTNYLTGLLYQIIPLAVSVILSLLVGMAMGALTGSVINQYFLWFLIAAAESIFFFSMSVCVLMFSGNLIAVPVFYGILNFLYAGCMMTVEAMVDSVCYGVSADLIEKASDSVLTPIIYMSSHINIWINEDRTYTLHGTKALAGYLAAAIVLTIIAVIAYQKKHIETAGDVITVEWLKPVFRWGASICFSAVGALFFMQMTYTRSLLVILISGAVAGIFVFFVSQMLLERSVRVFTKKRIREGIIFLLCICGTYIALDADVFGLEKKVPGTEDVQAVNVEGGLISMYGTAEEEISWVQDIHRQIISSKSEFEHSTDEDTIYVNIRYQLKNGDSLQRQYYIPVEEAAGSVSAKLEEYAAKPEIILKSYFGIHYPDIEVTEGDIQDYSKTGESIRIPENDAKKLYQAMVRDVEEGNFSPMDEIQDTRSEEWDIYMSFSVHDKQGFQTPRDLYYDMIPVDFKDGSTDEIWLRPEYKNLVKELQELGYLEKAKTDTTKDK